MKHRFFEINRKGRDIFAADIHGEWFQLREDLKAIDFDPSKDRFFTAGDLGDKGRYSRRAYQALYEPWLFSSMGNHDWHVAHWREESPTTQANWITNWGQWFADLKPEFQDQMRQAYRDKLPIAMTVDTPNGFVGITHAGIPKSTWVESLGVLADATERNQFAPFIFERKYYEDRKNTQHIKDLYALVVGHTPTDSMEIERYANTFFADTNGYLKKGFDFLIINQDLF